MTLRRRLRLQLAAMLAGTALLGVAGVVGVASLHADVGASLRANDQLRHTFTVGARVAAARAAVERSPAAGAEAAGEIARAADLFGTFDASTQAWVDDTEPAADAAAASLRAAADELARPGIDPLSAFAAPYGRLADLVAATRRAVVRRQQLADEKRQWTIVVLATLAMAVTLAAVSLGRRQYRAVMGPLEGVRDAARRIAAGRLAARAPVVGDDEFAALAGDFNRMAGDLELLYGDLSRQVAAKSRELAQSERLASVGFLAAGVAHEINNPLGIIAGHGERALMRLAATADRRVAESLRIIRDEAFRCKRITDGLLALARPEGEAVADETTRLDRLVTDVVATVTATPAFARRRATIHVDAGSDWRVRADEARLRQVVLNLTLNALEATDDGAGVVVVRLARADGDETIRLDVADNGRGMTPATLGRAFEPFYTDKRGRDGGAAGVGLGLSVAHAIVAGFGGTLRAHSDGPGRGSTFVVRLPAVSPVAGRAS